jgi:hypothetical protein
MTHKILIIAAALTFIACNEETPTSPPNDKDTVSITEDTVEDTVSNSIPGVYTMTFNNKTAEIIDYDFSRTTQECQTNNVLFTLNTNDSTLTIKGTEVCDGITYEVNTTLGEIMPSTAVGGEGYIEYWSVDIYSTEERSNVPFKVFGNYESIMMVFYPKRILHYTNK